MSEAVFVHPRTELVLGGQRSGKSRHAERRAQQWLAQAPRRRAVLIATANAGDEEMRQRIARHQADRALRVPGLMTLEETDALGRAITAQSRPDTLVVVECLTLWLTGRLMPVGGDGAVLPGDRAALIDEVCAAVRHAAGPVVLVGNEIGSGVIPLGAAVRDFVDTTGRLNQALAALCPRVTLMVAGLPLVVKGAP